MPDRGSWPPYKREGRYLSENYNKNPSYVKEAKDFNLLLNRRLSSLFAARDNGFFRRLDFHLPYRNSKAKCRRLPSKWAPNEIIESKFAIYGWDSKNLQFQSWIHSSWLRRRWPIDWCTVDLDKQPRKMAKKGTKAVKKIFVLVQFKIVLEKSWLSHLVIRPQWLKRKVRHFHSRENWKMIHFTYVSKGVILAISTN